MTKQRTSVILEPFRPFVGQHCETTAVGSLLYHLGLDYSEPMLFGLGEGLGYMVWKMKFMDFPFIGGRIKTDTLTENICRNLNLKLEVSETKSLKKAWKTVQSHIDEGRAVGLKLDCYHLEYFSSKFHFAGHYAAMYGYDERYAYLIDTDQQGGKVKTSLDSLALARNEKGPMSSSNRTFVISKPHKITDLTTAIKGAIVRNALDYLNPPIKNFGYKGILKTSSELKKWFRESKNRKQDLQLTAMLMERAGTGGSLFRNLYRDFLYESAEILSSKDLKNCANEFRTIASHWNNVSDLFFEAGETEDEAYINQAVQILVDLSERERSVMETLKEI